MIRKILILISLFSFIQSNAQVDESKLGNWLIYMYNTTANNSGIGVQGDVQYRNWNTLGDLEQLLIRSGVYYKPKNTNVRLTLGYASITTGTYGVSNNTTQEHRIYQEALIPNKVGERVYLTHRFRYEQRFIEDTDMRTRMRYNLIMNIPLNNTSFEKGTFYLSLYNEIFINGELASKYQRFDRNRVYAALGYVLNNNLKLQIGGMTQATNNWTKNQLQIGLLHKINLK